MTTGTLMPGITESANTNNQVPIETLHEPGCYVCSQTGQMIRVPEDALAADHTPRMCILGSDPMMLTKISDNPFVSLSKARMLAANGNLNVNF